MQSFHLVWCLYIYRRNYNFHISLSLSMYTCRSPLSLSLVFGERGFHMNIEMFNHRKTCELWIYTRLNIQSNTKRKSNGKYPLLLPLSYTSIWWEHPCTTYLRSNNRNQAIFMLLYYVFFLSFSFVCLFLNFKKPKKETKNTKYKKKKNKNKRKRQYIYAISHGKYFAFLF